jgi:hypothetical protein
MKKYEHGSEKTTQNAINDYFNIKVLKIYPIRTNIGISSITKTSLGKDV